MFKKQNIIIVFLLLAVLISCKTVRYVNGGKTETIRPQKLYRYLEENSFNFESLSLKFSANLDFAESSQSFSGNIRIKHDSIIWISLRSFNVEGIRVVITKDSVKFINRLDNTYYLGDFSFLQSEYELDIDYSTFEAILSNNFFFYPPSNDTAKSVSDFKLCDDSTYHCMSSISKRKYNRFFVDEKGAERIEKRLERESQDGEKKVWQREFEDYYYQTVKVMPGLFRVKEMYLENYLQQQSLLIQYEDQVLVETQFFPQKIFIELSSVNFYIELKMNIESLGVNNIDMSFPFKITNKYKEISLK
ncbi:MAG: DUF4292 domain-containing protein [Bacteroidales bacterium]|nr:DUF4292 domain-containing protein [Bacteroidales bacterium]MCK9498480.1 DUF4292 domain-containing protein [Bacteroidales bacterium]MDY0314132.1 DUF4292 domain-containing protein [Bacteroidales bacterium]NLB87112.1 DUF4292 domain-containing protein [Bacteroidales bacterium]